MNRSPLNDESLEDRIADVFRRQADSLDVPAVHGSAGLPEVVVASAPPPGRRSWVFAAAAGMIVLAVIGALVIREPAATELDPSAGAATFSFRTAQVRLDADGFVVATPSAEFVPPGDTAVTGDPGQWQRYTTLELVWFESGVEMRTNLYFESDGVDWWISEARTYDGTGDPDWRTVLGEYARTGLGRPFSGDLDLGDLQLREVRLEVSDPTIAGVVGGDMPGLLPVGMVRFEVEARAAGSTTVAIELTRDGAVVASLEMPVVIEDLPLSADVPE